MPPTAGLAAAPAAPPPAADTARPSAADARTEILDRIRRALAGPERDPDPAPRDYRRPLPDRPAPVILFAERVADYQARIHRTGPAGLAATVAAALAARHATTVLVPPGLDPAVTAEIRVPVAEDGPEVGVDRLDATSAVVTRCALAVAETGTVVLDGGAGQGRRALTLVPDHHVVVVAESQIVADVPAAVARLRPDAPQTWISGPSATSDIELDRVEGVHGPRQLDVVIVEGA